MSSRVISPSALLYVMESGHILSYFINEVNSIVVVTWSGVLARDQAHVLKNCEAEVLQKNPKIVILNLEPIKTNIEMGLIPAFAQLQVALRKTSTLRIVISESNVRKNVLDRGIVRRDELEVSLERTLKNLKEKDL